MTKDKPCEYISTCLKVIRFNHEKREPFRLTSEEYDEKCKRGKGSCSMRDFYSRYPYFTSINAINSKAS